jgi:hypothetical protein
LFIINDSVESGVLLLHWAPNRRFQQKGLVIWRGSSVMTPAALQRRLTMSSDMLGGIIRKLVTLSVETHGVVIDLLTKLEDPTWLAATKRFLRKENPWPEAGPLWERVSGTAIRVNLDAPPKLPFDRAKVEWSEGSGWVTVERRGDDLFVDGQKVVFHLVEAQKTGSVQGYELRTQLQGQRTLHPNIMDALFGNHHLLPESWKMDEQGRSRFIFFWAVGYCSSSGSLYVRSMYWSRGACHRNDLWLGSHWDVQHPAAVLSAS